MLVSFFMNELFLEDKIILLSIYTKPVHSLHRKFLHYFLPNKAEDPQA